MRYIYIIILFGLVSCKTQTIIYTCSSDLKTYKNFKFIYLEKTGIDKVHVDSIFSADILISVNNPDSMNLMDSICCYALAICNNESLAKARFYWNKTGYDIAKKYDLVTFETMEIQTAIKDYNDVVIFNKCAILSIYVGIYLSGLLVRCWW